MTILLKMIGLVGIAVSQISTMSSCFWFLHEPELPKDVKDE
ncbi:cyclic lactone autoinducer peptide [Halobacillus sp. Marseille-Q1614]|nr:cyclic lactone autoinducer peptide [Halobacillus sp. Marseille-Q1614]